MEEIADIGAAVAGEAMAAFSYSNIQLHDL